MNRKKNEILMKRKRAVACPFILQYIMLKTHKVFCYDSPDRICRMLEGKIFEVPLGVHISIPYKVLSERQSNQGTMVRIYSDDFFADAVPVQPNLEDVFLAVYADER